MPSSVSYHCPCLSPSPIPPPPHLPSSSSSFHPLHDLFFCEECDAVRCNRCVTVEVSGYYCPNCLFEVPSASVRAEKNRCARNCFMCPNCRNTLSTISSDPPEGSTAPISAVGEPPFYLYCSHCRWDSGEINVTFDKPTGLAAQLQKHEDGAPDTLEFDRLKEHFEPFLRSSSSASGPSHTYPHTTSAQLAASAALARDIPGVGKYTPHASRTRSSKDRSKNRDEFPEYKARIDSSKASVLGTGMGPKGDVEFLRKLQSLEDVAPLEHHWDTSWAHSLRNSELQLLRLPLHSKRSKRCPACAHILIKPEQKAQSVRFKIKLVAANYLPSITVSLPRSSSHSSSTRSELHAGKTYPFQLALTNPLYDPIQVKLSVQRMHIGTAGADASGKGRRPPFAISLPTSSFPVAAFAEAWEYDDDEDMLGDDDDFAPVKVVGGREMDIRGGSKNKMVGVLEKRANVTVVGGEVIIGKEAKGVIKFNMLVSYTYRSDDPLPTDDAKDKSKPKPPDTKTFAFYTVIELGNIIPRPEGRVEAFEG